jgi:hypothetical protein
MKDFSKPVPVEDAELTFGGDMTKLLPDYKLVPDEFKNHHNQWHKLVDTRFFQGFSGDVTVDPKEGIDPNLAIRHIKAILRSWSPKHEHKTAGCAYLLSLWFKSFNAG